MSMSVFLSAGLTSCHSHRSLIPAGMAALVLVLTGFSIAAAPWFSLVAVLCAAMGVVFLHRPAWSLYFLIFILPVSHHTLYIVNPAISRFAVVGEYIDVMTLYLPVIILAGIARVLRSQVRKQPISFGESHLLIPFTILFAYSFMTLFRAPDINHSLIQHTILGSHCLLFYIIIRSIRTTDILRRAMWAVAISGLVQAVVALFLYSLETGSIFHDIALPMGNRLGIWMPTGPLIPGTLLRRLNGTQESHITALMMAVTFPFILGLLTVEKKTGRRLVLMISAAAVCTAEVMALARGGVGAMFMAGLFTAAFLSRMRPWFILFVPAFGIGIIVLILGTTFVCNSLLNTDIKPRLIARTADAGDNVTQQAPQRIHLWKSSLKKLANQPLAGLGAGNMKLLLKAPHAHSIYFSFIFDFGLTGFIVLAWLGLTLINRYLTLPWVQTGDSDVLCVAAFGGLIAVLIHGLIDFEYNTTLPWLYLGLAIAASNLNRRNRQAQGRPPVPESAMTFWFLNPIKGQT